MGASIVLIALGLILALAVNVDISGLDIQVIGWILVLAGVVGLVMTTLIWGPRRGASGGVGTMSRSDGSTTTASDRERPRNGRLLRGRPFVMPPVTSPVDVAAMPPTNVRV
ncbi:MAG: DUF6458 family protein [Actinomycetota bacterium]|nr:DUF6458 family protein [Actinomycetota bacterium]